jgi:molecular chaperone DnaJ
MAQKRDYYEVLGVSRDASQEEIRKAYLKLAHKYHPDKTGGDKAAENKLKEINEAYDTLKNAEKRSRYDRFGAAGEAFGGAGGFSGFGFESGGFDSPFEDFFDVLFGRGSGGGRRRAARPGNDLEARVSITLKEAATGVHKQLHVNRTEVCSECKGTGAAPGSRRVECAQCGGTGQVQRSHGFFSISQTCPRCHGRGWVVEAPCARCGGTGRVKAKRELSVDIPAGVDNGSRLRVSGEGEPGDNGGPRGDLYIYVEIEPHDVFTREGNDIICEIPISFPQAALGATLRVPTLNGEAEIKVPAGTQPGTLFRLRKMGLPDVRGYGQGDEIVRVQIETPNRLTAEQKELLTKFQELSDAQSYPLHRRFMDKLKNSFGG